MHTNMLLFIHQTLCIFTVIAHGAVISVIYAEGYGNEYFSGLQVTLHLAMYFQEIN